MSKRTNITTLRLFKNPESGKFYWSKSAGGNVVADHQQGYSRRIDMLRTLERTVFPREVWLEAGWLLPMNPGLSELKIVDETRRGKTP